MRGGVLPPALLCAALGLALGFAPRRVWGVSLIALVTTAFGVALAPVPYRWLEGIFLGCWMSVGITGASVHLPNRVSPLGTFILSINAGLWSGAIAAVAGSPLDLMKALPCVLVVLPASLTVRWRASITVKVIASWLTAVAALAAALQFLPVTPGYVPDHLE